MLTYLISPYLYEVETVNHPILQRGRNWGTEMLINLLKLTIMSSRIWNLQSLKPGLNCQVSTLGDEIWVKVHEERGETWAGMFPDGPGFLWITDSIPWSIQMEATFIHPFFAMFSSLDGALPLLPDSSLPLNSRVCCVVPQPQQLLRKLTLWHGVATQSRVLSEWKRRVFEGNWKGCKDYVSFMCN